MKPLDVVSVMKGLEFAVSGLERGDRSRARVDKLDCPICSVWMKREAKNLLWTCPTCGSWFVLKDAALLKARKAKKP